MVCIAESLLDVTFSLPVQPASFVRWYVNADWFGAVRRDSSRPHDGRDPAGVHSGLQVRHPDTGHPEVGGRNTQDGWMTCGCDERCGARSTTYGNTLSRKVPSNELFPISSAPPRYLPFGALPYVPSMYISTYVLFNGWRMLPTPQLSCGGCGLPPSLLLLMPLLMILRPLHYLLGCHGHVCYDCC